MPSPGAAGTGRAPLDFGGGAYGRLPSEAPWGRSGQLGRSSAHHPSGSRFNVVWPLWNRRRAWPQREITSRDENKSCDSLLSWLFKIILLLVFVLFSCLLSFFYFFPHGEKKKRKTAKTGGAGKRFREIRPRDYPGNGSFVLLRPCRSQEPSGRN